MDKSKARKQRGASEVDLVEAFKFTFKKLTEEFTNG
jgi:hypothetical protein